MGQHGGIYYIDGWSEVVVYLIDGWAEEWVSAETQSLKPETLDRRVGRGVSAETWSPKPETPKHVCNMSIFHSLHKSPSFKWCQNPKLETWKYVCNMSIFHSPHRSPSFKCRNLKLETQCATCPFFMYIIQIIEFQVPMAKIWNLKPETWNSKICMQPFQFSLFAQITEFQVPKPETQNPVCNMLIVHLHYTDHQVLSAECQNPKPQTLKYVCNMSNFHLFHKSQSFACRNLVCNMFIVSLHHTDHRVLSAEGQDPKPKTRNHVHNMSIFHSLHKSPSVKCRNPKPVLQMDRHCIWCIIHCVGFK
jgi:hypothetical protein